MRVIERVEEYARRHRVKPSKVCHAATGCASLIRWIERGQAVNETTLARLLDFIDAHPGGLPTRQRNHAGKLRIDALPPRVVRDPCTKCGVRADIGCEHQPATRARRH